MTHTDSDQLALTAAKIMMRACADYVRANDIQNPDLDALTAALKARGGKALEQALADAKEAADLGMTQVAQDTFTATLVLAGIEAAQSVYPKQEGRKA
jgi:hypothetical protein